MVVIFESGDSVSIVVFVINSKDYDLVATLNWESYKTGLRASSPNAIPMFVTRWSP